MEVSSTASKETSTAQRRSYHEEKRPLNDNSSQQQHEPDDNTGGNNNPIDDDLQMTMTLDQSLQRFTIPLLQELLAGNKIRVLKKQPRKPDLVLLLIENAVVKGIDAFIQLLDEPTLCATIRHLRPDAQEEVDTEPKDKLLSIFKEELCKEKSFEEFLDKMPSALLKDFCCCLKFHEETDNETALVDAIVEETTILGLLIMFNRMSKMYFRDVVRVLRIEIPDFEDEEQQQDENTAETNAAEIQRDHVLEAEQQHHRESAQDTVVAATSSPRRSARQQEKIHPKPKEKPKKSRSSLTKMRMIRLILAESFPQFREETAPETANPEKLKVRSAKASRYASLLAASQSNAQDDLHDQDEVEEEEEEEEEHRQKQEEVPLPRPELVKGLTREGLFNSAYTVLELREWCKQEGLRLGAHGQRRRDIVSKIIEFLNNDKRQEPLTATPKKKRKRAYSSSPKKRPRKTSLDGSGNNNNNSNNDAGKEDDEQQQPTDLAPVATVSST